MNERRGRAARMLVAPVGLGLLILANGSLNQQQVSLVAVLALATGLVLWAADGWLASGVLADRPIQTPEGQALLPERSLLVALAGVATAATYAWSSDNTFRATGVACWIVAIVAWVVAWWPASRDSDVCPRRGRADRVLTTHDIAVIAVLVVAVAAGAFFRFYGIEATPLDPTSDHAEKLLDVTDVLNGRHPIFFERNTGREPAQFYVTAGLIELLDLPVNFTTLKIGTALIGTLAIPFIYLLAAELAGRAVGLCAAVLYAIGTWPVAISRAGLRFPYAILATAAVLWLLVRWMRTHDRRDALLLGVAVGAGLYGYSPFRIVVLVVGLGIAVALAARGPGATRRRLAGDALLIGATATVVFVPLGRYALEHPELFWYRADGRLAGDGERSSFTGLIRDVPVFLDNNWNAALGFNWRGDSTFVNAVTGAPFLDVVTGALFLAGLAALVTHGVRSRDVRAGLIVAAIPVLVLASTLSVAFPAENPSVNREGPAAPIVFAVAALPLAVFARRLRDGLGARRGYLMAVPAISVLVAIAAVLNFDRYFHDFDRQTRMFVANTTEIAEAISGAEAVGVSIDDAYIIDSPHWLDIRNVGIALGDIEWSEPHNVRVGDPLPEQPAGRPLLLILNDHDAERLAEVNRVYPDGYVSTYPAEVPSKSFVVVWVPAHAPPGGS